MTYVLIAMGGALGAIARFSVDNSLTGLTGGTFPWGTLVINLSGSFVIGVLSGLVIDRSVLPAEVRPLLMTGFVGAYTTFSTWMLESARLVEAGSYFAALSNIVGSVLLGGVCVVAGIALGRAI
jgi:fluoride exporter